MTGGGVVDATGGISAASLELLLDPQPLIAETKNINVSGANAVSALDLFTITTLFLRLDDSRGTRAAIE